MAKRLLGLSSVPVIPDSWEESPTKSDLIKGKFIAFKTPLDSRYESHLSEESVFDLEELFKSGESHEKNIGLLIDLTNTDRYYDSTEVKTFKCTHYKLRCVGWEKTPSKEETDLFITKCDDFFDTNPEGIIGVHGTSGFNRPGFLIICYLIERLHMEINDALDEFKKAREPGIIKHYYIQELFRRYDHIGNAPPAPEVPDWYQSTDLKSKASKKLCRFFQTARGCRYGDGCRFAHEWE